jgi:hypothetical protein
MKAPPELMEAVEEVRARLRVPPPRFEVSVDERAPTFRSYYKAKKIVVPGYWKEFSKKNLLSYLAHEHKHCSVDGYPGSYIEGKRCQAVLMAMYGLSASLAHRALNALFDAIINTRLHEEGFAIKNAMNAWVKKFPITEGTTYHLLHILHKHLIKTTIPPTDYERDVEKMPAFSELLDYIKKLIREGDRMQERKDANLVATAAYLLHSLVAVQDGTEGECEDGDEPVPEDQRDKVAEIAQQAGLDAAQLKDLLDDPNISIEKARELLAEATKGIARTEIWKSFHGFENTGSGSGRSIDEPYKKKWKGYNISKLDPLSVVLHKDDYSKWREKARRPFVTIDQPSSDNGFDEVIILLDRSSSTNVFYEGRPVFSYERDVAISAVGFARRENIPVSLILFDSEATVENVHDRHHIRIAEKIASMGPTDGSTDLGSAIDSCMQLNPKRALIAIVTDGAVAAGSFSSILRLSGQNRVVCAIVNPYVENSTLAMEANGKAIIIHVTPDRAGRTTMNLLKTLVASKNGLRR